MIIRINAISSEWVRYFFNRIGYCSDNIAEN